MRHTRLAFGLCSFALLVSCDAAVADDGKSIDLDSVGDAKNDSASAAKIVDSVGPEATVTGKFDPKVRVYGYVVQANPGAKISVALSAVRDGRDLDTRLEIHGPYTDAADRGEQIIASDDGDDGSAAAPPVSFEVTDNDAAQFLVAFTSWEDTGSGDYQLDITCEGTDFQCRRPNFERPCKAGELFSQGTVIDTDTEWDTCKVILLEPTTVAEGVTLTIRPGVEVLGNFLGNSADPFGGVGLVVEGRLQAVGTEKDPIRFAPFVDGQGWLGLQLASTGNNIGNAYIEGARNAIDLLEGASAEVESVVIDGGVGDQLSNAGILAAIDAKAVFRRALVKGNNFGLRLVQGENLVIEDSVIRDNETGIDVVGSGSRATSCGSSNATPPRIRDPRILRSDIVDNRGNGVTVSGDDVLIQISNSNIINNGGRALAYQGRRVNGESFVRESNIYGNNGTNNLQVQSFHRTGVLDLTGNFWQHVSDPALSQTRSACTTDAIDFTGFSPTELEAGPNDDGLIEDVKTEQFDPAAQ